MDTQWGTRSAVSDKRSPLTVAAIQLPCVPGHVAANALIHARMIAAISEAGARVAVFPELSMVGYELDLIANRSETFIVSPTEDPRLTLLRKACARHGVHAVVGAPVSHGVRVGLASMVFDEKGEHVATYIKHHLHGRENDIFVAGTDVVVVDVEGWRLGLAIGADVTFSEHARRTVAGGADAYLASSWPRGGTGRDRDDLVSARASENRCWVVLATHGGDSGRGHTTGGSGIWGPDGVVRSQAGPEVSAFAIGTLSDLPSEPPHTNGPLSQFLQRAR